MGQLNGLSGVSNPRGHAICKFGDILLQGKGATEGDWWRPGSGNNVHLGTDAFPENMCFSCLSWRTPQARLTLTPSKCLFSVVPYTT